MTSTSKTIMSVRPGKTHEGLIEKLEALAKAENRTLNNFACHILSNYVKTIYNEHQNAGQTAGGTTPSESIKE